jgi:hypothetical protein
MMVNSDYVQFKVFSLVFYRLLNALASTQAGRDYLGAGPLVLETLVRSLVQPVPHLDQPTTEMVVATLQKLSLK